MAAKLEDTTLGEPEEEKAARSSTCLYHLMQYLHYNWTYLCKRQHLVGRCTTFDPAYVKHQLKRNGKLSSSCGCRTVLRLAELSKGGQ
eukprot:1158694-Pelagomonas_calceolata.AAC.2